MKFTRAWLARHLATDLDFAGLAEAMTMAGLEVEDVHDPGAALAAFSVAKIIEAGPHPNADKLRVCQVDTKDGRKEIVCGAPNARTGLTTIYAPIGAKVPASGIVLEARPVRGVVSNGMLCSGAELGVDTESEGILELAPTLAVGAPAAAALGVDDPVIDFEVTPNRPDWLGVAGIARDLAACGAGRFIETAIAPVLGAFACPVQIRLEAPEACPIFAGRLIRGVRNGPSPAWLQLLLRAVGITPRSALVDITNFLCLDRARPLHVYDAAKLSGPIIARLGRAGESLAALDNKTYAVDETHCVIADRNGVLGLGGVIGGAASGVSAETTDVFLECAWFDPKRIARTGRALGIASDAQYRFARGVDPGFIREGIELATQMILDLCGGTPSNLRIAGKAPPPPAAIAYAPTRLVKLAGIEMPEPRQKAILTALGCRVASARARPWRVTPPTWRGDMEGAADVVEELARVYGYDKLNPASLQRPKGRVRPVLTTTQIRAGLARRFLAAQGYREAITWSFCARADAVAFGGGADQLMLANPIVSELDCMRPSALPGLLKAAQKNVDRGFADIALFEIGPIYRSDAPDGQSLVAAGVRHSAPQRHWRADAANPVDGFDLKGEIERALEALGAPVDRLQLLEPAFAWQHPGRSATLRLGPKTILAAFGEVHPRILRQLDVKGPMLGFELWIENLPTQKAKQSPARPALDAPDLMPLTRDFAFIVDEAISAQDIVRAVRGVEKALIADIAVFDLYRGAGVPEGKKSVAIEVTLQPRERSLTDDELAQFMAKVAGAVAKATGAVLRN